MSAITMEYIIGTARSELEDIICELEELSGRVDTVLVWLEAAEGDWGEEEKNLLDIVLEELDVAGGDLSSVIQAFRRV